MIENSESSYINVQSDLCYCLHVYMCQALYCRDHDSWTKGVCLFDIYMSAC